MQKDEIIGGTGRVARLHGKEGGFVRLIVRKECQSLASCSQLVIYQPPSFNLKHDRGKNKIIK